MNFAMQRIMTPFANPAGPDSEFLSSSTADNFMRFARQINKQD